VAAGAVANPPRRSPPRLAEQLVLFAGTGVPTWDCPCILEGALSRMRPGGACIPFLIHSDSNPQRAPSVSSTAPLRQILLQPSKRAMRIGRHPWILAASIVEPASQPRVGEQVDVVHSDGRWIGRGLYNPNSRIRVRMYAWETGQRIDEALILERLDRALDLRDRLGSQGQHDAMRLVFSEADQLSGLVVDRFGGHLVLQWTAAVLLPFLDPIVARLKQRWNPESVRLLVDAKTAQSEGMEAQETLLDGHLPSGPIDIHENGLTWGLDLLGGQKTGYYLDQRENRLAAARWAPSDGHVLDVCTYAGGFALTVAHRQPGCRITAIDSSVKALELAEANAVRNGLQGRVGWEQADLFEALTRRVDGGELVDMVILDPPKLAGSREQLQRALNAYHRLNFMAVRCLKPGGTLVTCSCSGRVSREDFREMLLGVSTRSRREIQILENRGASADHPVAISCPETDYLKCMIARVL
jgi:23S rRNA (cytosine1962-C5)-methyltransferase